MVAKNHLSRKMQTDHLVSGETTESRDTITLTSSVLKEGIVFSRSIKLSMSEGTMRETE